MSGSPLIAPGGRYFMPPLIQAPARTPSDTRPITLDWSYNLNPLGVTIASVSAVTITRRDNTPLVSGDLVVTAFGLINPLQVFVALAQGFGEITYVVTCQIIQSDGPTATRSILQPVFTPLG